MRPRTSTAARLLTALALLAPLGLVPPPAAAQEADRDALYRGGLSNLGVLSHYFTAEQRSRVPTLEAILHRVIYEPEQATPTEFSIATALVTGEPVEADGGARGVDPTDKMILGLHFKPLTVQKPGPAAATGAVKPVAASVNQGYAKITSAGRSVTYTSGVVRKPGGAESGFVELTKGTKRTRIVEIPTSVGDLSVATRARKIATRLASVQKRDPTWWNRIAPGRAPNGEAVVSLPNGSVPWILTADASFAREWNTTPPALAGLLVTKIRAAIDTSGGTRGVMATPEQEAIREKQAGDDAYAKADLAGAERHYQQAIKDSPGYVSAYKLLIGVYKEQKKTDRINDTLTQAQGEPSLTDEQIKEIQQAAQ